MRKSVWITLVMVLFGLHCIPNKSSAGNGEAVFESLKCGACHKQDQRAVAISLKEIANTFKDQETLITYFKGGIPAITESTRAGMMKGQLKNIQALPEADEKALADYILSFK